MSFSHQINFIAFFQFYHLHLRRKGKETDSLPKNNDTNRSKNFRGFLYGRRRWEIPFLSSLGQRTRKVELIDSLAATERFPSPFSLSSLPPGPSPGLTKNSMAPSHFSFSSRFRERGRGGGRKHFFQTEKTKETKKTRKGDGKWEGFSAKG